MVKEYIELQRKEWSVVLICDFDERDHEEMAAIMESVGMCKCKVDKSLRILSTYNSGMTLSNDALKMSVVFIGRASSVSQFWDTCVHELKHCCDAIVEYYGDVLDGEEAAYIMGDLMLEVVRKIAPPCY